MAKGRKKVAMLLIQNVDGEELAFETFYSSSLDYYQALGVTMEQHVLCM